MMPAPCTAPRGFVHQLQHTGIPNCSLVACAFWVLGMLQIWQRDGCVAVGESDAPQGVVNTSDGRVVRAFHRFTLVDQTGQGRDLTKGRRRDQVNEQVLPSPTFPAYFCLSAYAGTVSVACLHAYTVYLCPLGVSCKHIRLRSPACCPCG